MSLDEAMQAAQDMYDLLKEEPEFSDMTLVEFLILLPDIIEFLKSY